MGVGYGSELEKFAIFEKYQFYGAASSLSGRNYCGVAHIIIINIMTCQDVETRYG